MLGKAISLSIKGIVLVIFLGWVSSKILTNDLGTPPSAPMVEDVANGSGSLIVPNSDPRFQENE